MTDQGGPKSVLFITCSDYGQANVMLSVASELLRSSFAVHVASTATLAPRVAQLGPHAQFHLIPGDSMFESYLAAGHGVDGMIHRPGILGAVSSFTNVDRMMQHWMDGRYLALYENCVALLEGLMPNIVVVDPVCAPQIDACRSRRNGQKLIILSPMGLKDLLVPVQPWAGVLWKYPVMSSGYPFPLPIHLMLANVYILLRLALVCFLLSSRFRQITAARKAAGIPGPLPSIQPYVSNGTHYLVPDLPELSLPLDVIPRNVTACGPIVPLPIADIEATASTHELLQWMRGGETVLMSFGSHLAPSRDYCTSLAKGLGRALQKHPRLRILWKRKLPQDDDLPAVTGVLGDAWTEGRIKIVEWLEVAPAHLLMVPGVVVSVHHGGANTYFETCRAGVPHIILPAWYDTYGNATCAEFLNIGIYGNKSCAPDVSAAEFGDALCMLLDENSMRGRELRATAQALGQRCRKEDGREAAANLIRKMAREEM